MPQPTEIAFSETNWESCPNCNSDIIEAGTLEVEGNIVFQQIQCRNCDTTWTEEYTAIMRSNIEYPKKE